MTQLIHTLDSHMDLVHDDVTLFSYVYRSQVPAYESPRPYFHPLRTRGGKIVSGFRPHDHRWHHGLSMTCAHLSGQILMSDGREGAELMGQSSPWLAYIGQHDETDDYSTLIWVDGAANPRHPTPWFVRNSTPMVCPYFAFHQEYQQAASEVLNLSYRMIIADGKWTREQIEAVV